MSKTEAHKLSVAQTGALAHTLRGATGYSWWTFLLALLRTTIFDHVGFCEMQRSGT